LPKRGDLPPDSLAQAGVNPQSLRSTEDIKEIAEKTTRRLMPRPETAQAALEFPESA